MILPWPRGLRPADGIEKNSPDSSEIGSRFLIAEEVESGLDLPMNQFNLASEHSSRQNDDAVAGQLASEEEEVDLTEMSPTDVVDRLRSISAPRPPSPPRRRSRPLSRKRRSSTRPYQAKSKSIHGEVELFSSEVNLGASTTSHPRAAISSTNPAASEVPTYSRNGGKWNVWFVDGR